MRRLTELCLPVVAWLGAACSPPAAPVEAPAPAIATARTSRCEEGHAPDCHRRAAALADDGAEGTRQAVALYAKACDAGHLPSCSALGRHHEIGHGVEVHADKAMALYRRACDGGDHAGCVRVGAAKYFGLLDQRHDLAGARALFERACKAGHDEGCARWGVIRFYGAGVPEDVEGGRALIERACDRGDGYACHQLAQRLENDDHDAYRRDMERAVELYHRACKAGWGEACLDLSWLFLRGFSVRRDLDRGFALSERACHLGDADGCANVGHAYFIGEQVPQDLDRAVAASADACRRLSQRGCRNLGLLAQEPDLEVAPDEFTRTREHLEALCRRDEGRACALRSELDDARPDRDREQLARDERNCYQGEQASSIGYACDQTGWNYEWGEFHLAADARKAADAYRRSCDAGHINGCVNWGWALMRGFGTSMNLVEANALFEKACIEGNRYGCNNLGWSLEQGLGIARNLVEAVDYYRMACDRDDALGCGNLGELLRDLGRLAEAEEALARGCALDHNGSCRWLAEILLSRAPKGRQADPADVARAREVLRNGCDSGRYVECGMLEALP